MTCAIHFIKMHGLGNDFVIIDAITQNIDIKALPITRWAQRSIGIGFDQLLVVTNSTRATVACVIFNADGSLAEQCGNGLRCVARYVHEHKLCQTPSFTIETKVGIFAANVIDYDTIQVTLGLPNFQPAAIPLHVSQQQEQYSMSLADGTVLTFSALSLGNPHAIIHVTALATCAVANIGKQLSMQSFFPQGVNVGFVETVNRTHIKLRTYERGVGETFACGSNACAAVVAGIRLGTLDREVTVELAYGKLDIFWEHNYAPVKLSGPATHVFTGQICLLK